MPHTAHKLSLAHAIRKNAKSLAQAQNTYKQNVVVVNTFITGVLSSSLPPLNDFPPDWQNFVTAYEAATGDALNWVNDVMARLLNVPGEVQNYDSLVTMLLQDALNQTAQLQSNPGNKAALAALNNDLSGLQDQLGLVISFISGAITQLQKFQDVLPDMATQLQSIATASINDANADKQQIANLNAQIQQLQSDIQSLTTAIIALGIADGVALTLGIVVSVAAFPVGLLAWLMLGPAVAVATTFIALDAVQIKNDKAAISALEGQITGITADVSTLTLLSNTYAAMANQTAQIQTDLQAILQEWQTLDSDVSQAVSEIQAAVADGSSANFTAVANDLNDAVTEWNAAYTQAGALTVQLKVNNAPLQLGMSSTQVQQTLGQGQVVDIITYYNQVSAAAKAKRFAPQSMRRAS
jgi:phage host-nuclease inhibitor protein Gam